MFTIAQIEEAHSKVKAGSDFPQYIREIKAFGVLAFETWVNDSHTNYIGHDNFQIQSNPKYDFLTVHNNVDKAMFVTCLINHQKGNTNYFTFCNNCAENGIAKWKVDLSKMTCTYFDLDNNEILEENIPSSS